MTDQTLAEQIKLRVRQADQERITKRADAAAAVAAQLHERDQLKSQLDAAEAKLQQAVASATRDLLSERELAEFIGVKATDLSSKPKRAPRKKRVTPDGTG